MRKNETVNVEKYVSNIMILTRLAIIAAMYVAMTLAVPALSFSAIQCRFSEILVLLCFYRKDYSIALILGCFIANWFSPLGWYDLVFGVAATAIAVVPMYYVKNVFIAALLPVISNAVLVGIELTLAFGDPVWINAGSVALGELIVMAAGAVIFKFVFEKNAPLMRLIGSTRNVQKNTV